MSEIELNQQLLDNQEKEKTKFEKLVLPTLPFSEVSYNVESLRHGLCGEWRANFVTETP